MNSDDLVLDVPSLRGEPEHGAYRSVVERLYALARSGTKYGLDRMRRVLAALDHPESVPSIHVAGSNGKGSTCAFLASILARHGLRVGLFTSPHLVSLTERIQFLEGDRWSEIGPEALVRAVQELEEVAPGFEGLSFFEVVTAAGLVAMRQRGVDVAVVEAGLGARLDATRLVEADLAVLTDLSLEHTAILGDTLADIAREEGAVVRPGRPLVMADGPAEAMQVVDGLASAVGASVRRLGTHFLAEVRSEGFRYWNEELELSELRLSLRGPHQARNAALAVDAALAFLERPDPEAVAAGLAAARWPGRLERRQVDGRDVWLDGAQNPHAAWALARALEADGAEPMHLVFGVLGDKDAGPMLDALVPWARSWTLTRPGSVRARDPGGVARMLLERGVSDVVVTASPERAWEAVRQRDPGPVLVCGSLYLVGDFRSLWVPRPGG